MAQSQVEQISLSPVAQEGDGHRMQRRRSARQLSNTEALSIEHRERPVGAGILGSLDVFSLIVNKMIGTGVYGAPVSVYILSGDKRLSLGLWGLGFASTIVSMGLYLDYAAALPYTGGELIYFEEITAYSGSNPDINVRKLGRLRRYMRRLGGDGLLAYVTYSIFYIAVFNSGSNAMQFGRMILLAVQANEDAPDWSTPDVNRDLARFIGMVAMSLLCLIQYFSPTAGRQLNTLWALVKIIFVVVLIGFAGYTAAHRGSAEERAREWNVKGNDLALNNWAKALLGVMFSFEGWENATFVRGEIPERNHYVLRRGFMAAVFVVGFLYLGVAAAVLDAIPPTLVDSKPANLFFPPMLSGNTPAARRAWAVLAAISALGSLNSIIYTFSRVKQAIGQANILPWSHIWKADHLVRNSEGEVVDRSPVGGLILHWVMTAAVVAGTSYIKNTVESINTPGNIMTYTHVFVLLILGIAFVRLPRREAALQTVTQDDVLRISQQTGFWFALIWVIIFLYCGLNLLVLVFSVWSWTAADGATDGFKGFGYPAVLFSLLLFALGYYVLVFGAAPRFYPATGAQRQNTIPSDGQPAQGFVEEPGMFSNPARSLLSLAHVRVEIRKDDHYDIDYERVNRFGRRWRARYLLRRDLRHPDAPGRGFTDEGEAGDDDSAQGYRVNFLYWFFGGKRWISLTPWRRLTNWWDDRIGSVIRWFRSGEAEEEQQ